MALVMGASSGLGRAIATALAAEGAVIALSSRSEEALNNAAAEIDGRVEPFVADTTDLDRVAALAEEVTAALGPIEILITNTGGPPLGGALDHGLEDWERAYRSLVLTPRVLAGALVPAMRRAGWGRIVNVGSSSTREPIPGLNLSNSHRMAALGFLKTLSREVAAEGITVNTVATGRFATKRIAALSVRLDRGRRGNRPRSVPAGRLGRPEEYGDLVAFLCSERAAYITGAVIPIDGGLFALSLLS